MALTGRHSFLGRLRGPLFTGVSRSAEVPGLYPIGLDGRPYMLDWTAKAFSHDTIPLLKPYFLTDGDVDERTLNPDAGWRRSETSWHHGAGQLHLDHTNSDRDQYYSSKGVDPWTQWQLKLLPDTDQLLASAHTNLEVATADTYLYLIDGAAVKWRNVGDTSFTSAGAGSVPVGMCSDGFNIYLALPSGVGLTTKGSTTTTTGWNLLVPETIAFVNGRLMAAAGPSIYNVTSGQVATPTHLSVTQNGATGAATYGYRVSGVNAVGETLACAEVTIANGNASLTPTNNVGLSWDVMPGATGYNVYGRTAAGELKMTVAPVTTNSFTDDGSVTPSGALPATDTTSKAPGALWTHPNADWTWVGFAEGQACIYAAGFSGDKSQVYRIGLTTDGTALTVPVACLPGLPTGEVVNSISTYLGLVILGTSEGVRQASANSNGDLTLGARIDTTNPVRCAVGGDRFVWFGMENYDTISTGLGRMDLQNATASGVSAWASDLMAQGQGQVTSVVTWGGLRVFTVSGVGVYVQSANLVPSGWLRQGLLTYNIPDPKIAYWVDVRRVEPLAGSFTVALDADAAGFVTLGTQTGQGHTVLFSGRSIHGETLEAKVTLLAGGTDQTKGPVVTRITLVSVPSAQSGQTFSVPVLLARNETPLGESEGSDRWRDIDSEITFFEDLHAQKRVVTYQEFTRNYTVTLEDFKIVPMQAAPDGRSIGNLTAVLTLKTIDTPTAG